MPIGFVYLFSDCKYECLNYKNTIEMILHIGMPHLLFCRINDKHKLEEQRSDKKLI